MVSCTKNLLTLEISWIYFIYLFTLTVDLLAWNFFLLINLLIEFAAFTVNPTQNSLLHIKCKK